jgi:hypothetical protein
MKKLFFIFVLLSMACTSIIPTPNDFPTPSNDFPPSPMTIIVEPTFPPPTATLEPRLHPITDQDMMDAHTFFLIIKTQILAGDDVGFAEKVHYPIQVVLNGKKTTFTDSSELAKNMRTILTKPMLEAITQASEDDLVLLPDGIRVGRGELWFNLYCTDPTCTNSQFLITQINN